MTDNTADSNERIDPDRPWTDPSRLHELYHGERLSHSEVADRLECSRRTVQNWMDEFGIESRSQSESQYVFGPDDAEDLRRLYVEELRTAAEIGEQYGCHETAVLETLRRFDIPVRPQGAESNTLILRDAELLREMYLEQRMTMYDIADELEVGGETVRMWLQNHGVTLRSGYYGEEHPNWRGGIGNYNYGYSFRRNRLKAISRDGGECQDCGLSRERHERVYDHDIEVHHIEPYDPRIPDEPQNKLTNLVTLCRDCHMNRHRGE